MEYFSLSCTRPCVAQSPEQFRRESDVLRGHQMFAFHQLEPRCLRSHDRVQFFQRSLHHGGMILTTRDRDRQLI